MRPKEGRSFDVILLFTALLSAFLNTFNIWKNQSANAYYTAAVTSMLHSWHNFFFASFDPGGFVTVDKPPVTFWIQTFFAYVFGVHGWSVILPQALAGVGSVLLIYILVKPTFGKTAARLSGLVMACTPVAVAVSRTNNVDSILVFNLLLATWMLMRAYRRQKLAWVLGAFALIGLGFNIKMLQAYMVVPAFYLFYLLAFKIDWKKKISVLALATVIMIGISLSWAVVVDSMPKSSRPYIGSSQTNSVLELAFGYNGISRLTGNRGGMGPGGQGNAMRKQMQQTQQAPQSSQTPQGANNQPGGFGASPNGNQGQNRPFDWNGGQGRNMGGGGGMFGTGQAGPLRLFQKELSGQSSWLLPFVAFACVGLLAGIRRRKALTDKEKETFFWLAWLLPAMAFFSVAGFFHQYYLIMLAPPIAVMTGAGWVELYNQYRSKEGWKRWLLPSSLLITTAFELYILQPYQKQIGLGWSIGIGIAGLVLSLILFLAAKNEKMCSNAAIAGMLILLVAPVYWAAYPMIYGDNNVMPAAGPGQQGFGFGQPRQSQQGIGQPPSGFTPQDLAKRQGMGKGQEAGINTKLLDFVTKNNNGETYLFATTSSNEAAPYIIKTGKAVIAMGGFSGSDPILTVEKIKQLVAKKEVKYFLIPSGTQSGFGGREGMRNNKVLDWIRANSTVVPKAKWQSGSTDQRGFAGMGNDMALYQIKTN